MTISDLAIGQEGNISRFLDRNIEGKLLGMGVKPGSSVTLIRKTNFDKTLYLKINTSRMAIRSEEADLIEISRDKI